MKKSQRNLMLLLLVVGVLVFGKGFGLFSIVDDYTTYYAFDGSSQAIADLQNVNTFKFNCLAGEYSPAYCGTICREPPYVYDISNPKGCSTSTFTSDCVGYSITYICSDDLFTIQTKTGYSASRSWETKIDTSGVMSFASDYVFNNLETASLPITLTKNMKGNYLKFLVTGRYVYDPKHNHYGGLLL